MKKTITVYVCDFGDCDVEIKSPLDGLVVEGKLHTANGEVVIAGSEHDPYAICWRHFHEKFPSPQILDYERRVEKDDYILRGGPDDR